MTCYFAFFDNFFLEDLANCLILITFMLENAVSVDEKKPDNISNTPNTIIVVNKVDEIKYDKLITKLQVFNGLKNVVDIVPISAKTGKNVDELIKVIKSHLKEGVKYFLNDEFTDKSERFLVSEAIREKVLLTLQSVLNISSH